MGKVLSVVLVGVGNRGRWPVELCRPEAGWQVVGLVDRELRFLAEARAATGLPDGACFGNMEQALDAKRPDAVILCTPTKTHAPFAKAALRRGVAVLTEKGMATCWDEAKELVDFVREQRGVLAVAQNYRYDGKSAVMRAALSGDEKLQDIPRLEGVFLVDYVQHRVRPLPGTLTYPFASVWDMSCHHFDNMLDWLGPVAEVTAQAYGAAWSSYEHASNTSAFLRFGNGVVVNYVHTHDAGRGSLRIEAQARNGNLVVREDHAEFSERSEANFGERPVRRMPLPERKSEAAVLADFHAYVAEGREPGISGYRNLETMALCELVVRSATLRRAVRREELNG
jgi:predicted dehydrogenase